jgi:hypothetical protein
VSVSLRVTGVRERWEALMSACDISLWQVFALTAVGCSGMLVDPPPEGDDHARP